MAMVRKMSPVEGALLSLTCKALWARVTLQSTDILHNLQRCLRLDQTMHFLRMLEKDNCRYVICTACLKIHRRMKEESSFVRVGWGGTYGLRTCSDELGSVAMETNSADCLRIHREVVELLLRRATLGPEYGPSLDILLTSYVWDVWSVTHFKVMFSSAGNILRGRDHDDHLLLKTTYNFEVDLRRPVTEQVKDSSAGACHHDTPEQQKLIAKAVKSPNRSMALWTCSQCPTDMLVDISEIPGEVFSTINISVIRDAGSRGDHRLDIWRSQSYQILGRHSHRTSSFDRAANYAFGNRALHGLWDEAGKLGEAEEVDTILDTENTPAVPQNDGNEDSKKKDEGKEPQPKYSEALDSEDKHLEDLGKGLFD